MMRVVCVECDAVRTLIDERVQAASYKCPRCQRIAHIEELLAAILGVLRLEGRG